MVVKKSVTMTIQNASENRSGCGVAVVSKSVVFSSGVLVVDELGVRMQVFLVTRRRPAEASGETERITDPTIGSMHAKIKSAPPKKISAMARQANQ